MKYALLFALLSATALSAQSTPAIDSTWTVNVAGVFYSDHMVQRIDGSSVLTRTRLGDTTQVLNTYVEQFKEKTRSMATDIEWTSSFPTVIKELIRQDAAVNTTVGRSPIKQIVAKQNYIQVDSIYKIKHTGSPAKTIKFSVTAAGQMRYKVDTFTIRNVSMLGDVMRLNNYQNSGNAMDLYLFTDRRWRDATRSVQVYQQADGPGVQNRAAPADNPETIEITGDGIITVKPSSILYQGGYALVSGKFYKYNIKAKKWVVSKPSNPIPEK